MAGINKELFELAEVKIGYQTREKIEEDLQSDYLLLRPSDIDDFGNIEISKVMKFKVDNKIDVTNYYLDKNDIVVQARGLTHFAYLINYQVDNLVASNSFYIIRVKSQDIVLPNFIKWWINQSKTQWYFEQNQRKSTIPFISKKTLSETLIELPSLATQEKIIKLLSLNQKEQTLTKKLYEKKDLLVQAIARKTVSMSKEENNDR